MDKVSAYLAPGDTYRRDSSRDSRDHIFLTPSILGDVTREGNLEIKRVEIQFSSNMPKKRRSTLPKIVKQKVNPISSNRDTLLDFR